MLVPQSREAGLPRLYGVGLPGGRWGSQAWIEAEFAQSLPLPSSHSRQILCHHSCKPTHHQLLLSSLVLMLRWLASGGVGKWLRQAEGKGQ